MSMLALTQDEESRTSSIKEIAIPQLELNDVLVRVEYACQNPTDWKHTLLFSRPGSIIGCDFSGTIVSIGSEIRCKDLQLGDRVAGCVHGGTYKDQGAYAEFVKAESDMLWKIPGGMSLPEASSFGVPWLTACQAMVQSQQQSFPPSQVLNKPWYLIYGASSSVGLFAIQLAKAMGYRVIAICSPHNYELVKEYGADATADYHSGAACGLEVKSITNGGVRIGLDTISEGDSFEIAMGGFATTGGRLNVILAVPDGIEVCAEKRNIEVVETLMYTLFGKSFFWITEVLPALPGHREFGVEVFRQTPALIERYGVKAPPMQKMGALKDVPAGFEHMKHGRVSARKLYYEL